PVDGEISQLGPIQEQCLLQAKGHSFSLVELLGGDVQMAELFKHGSFCTLYLSPKDYHRIHMPITGQLTDMVYVPGRLFSVNQRTARTVPRLFARNERVICLFATERGPVALVLVGAIFVGSIETVWSGRITPPYLSQLQRWHFTPEVAQFLQQGAEMGRFNLGSTVIVLVDGRQIAWLPEYAPPLKLLMGQALGRSLLP
ncbi:MAG: phosphatidylserine decarboxylase, partial [Beggiatoa sp. IS2]